jgi:hypothetical protein
MIPVDTNSFYTLECELLLDDRLVHLPDPSQGAKELHRKGKIPKRLVLPKTLLLPLIVTLLNPHGIKTLRNV